MASPSLERKEPQGRPLYSFELADIIGASMTPEMLYERWVVQREELETARTSESEHQGRYAQDPIRRRGLVSAGYTGYRNRRKPAGTKKSIRRMIQELALPPHRRDATPFATKTSRSWKKSSSASSPRPEAAQTSRSWKTYASRGVGTPSCCGGPRPVAAETSRSWKKIPIGGKQQPRFTRLTLAEKLSRAPTARSRSLYVTPKRPKRGPCGFMGPLKPTVPRTPKTREERKKEGTEAMRMPRKKKVPSIFSRIASCRPDYVKMGQQRGKTTSFEVWQRQQREIARKEEEERAAAEAAAAAAEEEEAEAAAAAELDPAQQSVPLRSGRGALLNGKSATLELSEHEHHDPSADHSRGRSLQPQHIDKLHHKKTGEVDDDGDDGDKKEGEEEEEKEEGEEETDSEKSSSYASSTKSIRVAERPKMPRWAPGFIFSDKARRGYVRPTYDMLPTIFTGLISDEERRLRKLAKKYGMSILDVEKVKKELDSYDADNSGTIDREEFNTFIRNVFGAKDKYDIPARRLEEFWKMLDTDQKGEVTLEEFVGFFWKYFWTRGGDVPGAQLSLLDCIGRVPTWSEERINGIAFGHLLNRLNDALEGEESESDEDKGCVEPEPVSLKLVKAVLLRILEKRLRSYPSSF